MAKNNITLNFIHDKNGSPMVLVYNGVNYYYVTNAQGDVMSIVDSSGNVVVTYFYDAFGQTRAIQGSMASTIGAVNPYRYRGYVWDTESGLYYLQSRYYAPDMGRFINVDSVYDTDAGIQGYNLFVYCGNNPINRIDVSGADSEPVADADITNDYIDDKENGQSRGSNRRHSTGNSTSKTGTGTTTGGGTTTTKSSSTHGGKWPTIRRNHWKTQAAANPNATGELSSSGTYYLTESNIDSMKDGLAPVGTDGKKVQLHHPCGIVNDIYNYYEIRATDHWGNYKALHQFLYK